MPDIVHPIINGHRYSFASIDLHVYGKLYLGVVRIAYGSSLKPGIARGSDSQRIGRTPGEVEHRCEIEMLQREFGVLLAELGYGFGLAVFDIQVVFAERGRYTRGGLGAGGRDDAPPEGVTTHQILGCRITDVDFQSDEGIDANTVRVTIDPTRIAYGAKDRTIDQEDEPPPNEVGF